MTNNNAALDRVFHALADPTRRAIVQRLGRGPASVGELAKPLSMALPTVLQHLQVLETSRLIRSQKIGRVRTCQLEPNALSTIENWIGRQRMVWEARLDRMEAYIKSLPDQGGKHGK
jgi:DNA-binding transcriptional ArsR family regulator